jgi:hypothetical protein
LIRARIISIVEDIDTGEEGGMRRKVLLVRAMLHITRRSKNRTRSRADGQMRVDTDMDIHHDLRQCTARMAEMAGQDEGRTAWQGGVVPNPEDIEEVEGVRREG